MLKELGDDLTDFDDDNLHDDHLQDDDKIMMTKSQLDDRIKNVLNKSLGSFDLKSLARLTQLLTLLNSNFSSAMFTQCTFSFPK